MPSYPRIEQLTVAHPEFLFPQKALLHEAQNRLLGADWQSRTDLRGQAERIQRLFDAAAVEQRQSVVDLPRFYKRTPTTAERMRIYEDESAKLALAAAEPCYRLTFSGGGKGPITDLLVVSCTGYSAPGVDVQLARGLELDSGVRRTVIGHMGCYGAIVGLRQAALSAVTRPGHISLLVSVELCSLHFTPTTDLESLTTFALFGDAAAAVTIQDDPGARGPAIVDCRSFADFSAAEQMSWRIGDEGFVMGLSPRVPVTLRRQVRQAVETLLSPHGLSVGDVRHWIVHPGGPSILQAVQDKLELSDEQMARSRQVLREHGNCSSATVLIILSQMMGAPDIEAGDWCVMMAFGPGLTIEMCLLRFD